MAQQTVDASLYNAETASGVANFLTPVVHNLIALAVNSKQAHWHLRGMNFVSLHEFLDEVHEHAVAAYDEAAERIIALGLPVDARLGTVAAQSSNPALSSGFLQAETVVTEMVAQMDAVIAVLKEAISGLDDIDLASQDVAISILQQMEKDRWFLSAHVGV